ncbi:hypothetical protein [Amycolatopsis sp.]|uniref:hypothetical protein n=1 Tax=Amycolatopsis sp. TaxID=37632 RepID=UPI002CAD571A|nr:hypothetical protein [Amycolatopsis sp.]HVV12056.1 hypothetical protein [Amycolatopsis sp.]
MRFSLDGERFELTPELVRRCLAGQAPEDIREYWVEIDGVRWPVKQVIGLATGAKRTRFQSQDSRRWLRNLGFQIGTGASSGATVGSAPRVGSSPRQRFDPGACEVLESLELQIAFEWLKAGKVSLDAAGLPRFPVLPRMPGLYRFDFGIDEDGVRSLYIGESVELARRASNYRNAKTDRSRQRTSRRIHKEIVEHLTAGGTIEFAIATEVHLEDGLSADLRLKSARRLAENAAVLSAQTAPCVRVLNIDADLDQSDSDD